MPEGGEMLVCLQGDPNPAKLPTKYAEASNITANASPPTPTPHTESTLKAEMKIEEEMRAIEKEIQPSRGVK